MNMNSVGRCFLKDLVYQTTTTKASSTFLLCYCFRISHSSAIVLISLSQPAFANLDFNKKIGVVSRLSSPSWLMISGFPCFRILIEATVVVSALQFWEPFYNRYIITWGSSMDPSYFFIAFPSHPKINHPLQK